MYPIDIIGCFALHTGNGIVELPVRYSALWNHIKVSSPELWYVAYKIMKREKKESLLLEFLRSNP
ncbi:hypothetical protein D3C75_611100 [compost metagenome]